jgi:hypothetical protein
MVDPRCAWVISIDPRPGAQPDVRGQAFSYPDNSTKRMMENLRRHLPERDLQKLQTFDLDAASVPRSEVQKKAHLALIDGEHTVTAAFSDFLSILPFLAEDAVVAFHDSNLIMQSIQNADRFLAHSNIPFRSMLLSDNVATIGLRSWGEALVADTDTVCLDRTRFVAETSRALAASIATEVLRRGDLGLLTPTRLAGRAFIQKRLAWALSSGRRTPQ